MSSANSSVNLTVELPLAAILCIVIGGYTIVALVAALIVSLMKQSGKCQCNAFAKDDEPCCAGCASAADACDCCENRSLNACMNATCPQNRHYDCIDILCCGCCSKPGATVKCTFCSCDAPECEDCVCGCFECAFRSKSRI